MKITDNTKPSTDIFDALPVGSVFKLPEDDDYSDGSFYMRVSRMKLEEGSRVNAIRLHDGLPVWFDNRNQSVYRCNTELIIHKLDGFGAI